jgi:hypothetical protein
MVDLSKTIIIWCCITAECVQCTLASPQRVFLPSSVHYIILLLRSVALWNALERNGIKHTNSGFHTMYFISL